MEILQTRLARLLAEFIASQSTIKQRIHRLENKDLTHDEQEILDFQEDNEEYF